MQNQTNTKKRGFYLVYDHGNKRAFISATVDTKAWSKACDKCLADTNYDYWIDFYYGLDVHGAECWENLDLTDKFYYADMHGLIG